MLESEVADPAGAYHALRIVDAVAFVEQQVLPRLPVTRTIPSMALHPTCSSTRMGMNESLRGGRRGRGRHR